MPGTQAGSFSSGLQCAPSRARSPFPSCALLVCPTRPLPPSVFFALFSFICRAWLLPGVLLLAYFGHQALWLAVPFGALLDLQERHQGSAGPFIDLLFCRSFALLSGFSLLLGRSLGWASCRGIHLSLEKRAVWGLDRTLVNAKTKIK